MITGSEIRLTRNYDWNEEVIIVFGFLKCSVFLFVEEELGTPSFLKLTFENVLCTKSARTDCCPSLGIEMDKVEAGNSCIVELFHSGWAEEAHNSYRYDGTSSEEKRHFSIEAHDVFHEILADGFNETLITENDSDYAHIKVLFPSYLF